MVVEEEDDSESEEGGSGDSTGNADLSYVHPPDLKRAHRTP
jgi:hypothetical protein